MINDYRFVRRIKTKLIVPEQNTHSLPSCSNSIAPFPSILSFPFIPSKNKMRQQRIHRKKQQNLGSSFKATLFSAPSLFPSLALVIRHYTSLSPQRLQTKSIGSALKIPDNHHCMPSSTTSCNLTTKYKRENPSKVSSADSTSTVSALNPINRQNHFIARSLRDS